LAIPVLIENMDHALSNIMHQLVDPLVSLIRQKLRQTAGSI